MRAQDAISKTKSERTIFMGHDVDVNPYAINVRDRLQKMAETGELSPGEYNKAMGVTWPEMSESEKAAEYDNTK